MIIRGGDFNNKNLRVLLSSSPELIPIGAGPTRQGAALDEIYTNISRSISHKEVLRPLSKEDGTLSDHSIVAVVAKLPKFSREATKKFTFRPLTKKGTEKFKSLLLSTDWNTVKKSNASTSTDAFTSLLDLYIEQCFPLKTRKASRGDVPWSNQKTRKLSNKKKKIYNQEGKSDRYKSANKEYEVALKSAKKAYLDDVIIKCKKSPKTLSHIILPYSSSCKQNTCRNCGKFTPYSRV